MNMRRGTMIGMVVGLLAVLAAMVMPGCGGMTADEARGFWSAAADRGQEKIEGADAFAMAFASQLEAYLAQQADLPEGSPLLEPINREIERLLAEKSRFAQVREVGLRLVADSREALAMIDAGASPQEIHAKMLGATGASVGGLVGGPVGAGIVGVSALLNLALGLWGRHKANQAMVARAEADMAVDDAEHSREIAATVVRSVEEGKRVSKDLADAFDAAGPTIRLAQGAEVQKFVNAVRKGA